MPCLSLRGTISALTACCVAIVAIITLSITLTTSLSALRDIGKTHAAALLANARLQTEDLFQKPARATAALRNITMSSTWNWPSDDPTVLTMFQTLARDQFLTCGVECVIGLFFYDSTRFTMQVAQFANLPQPEYGGDLYLPAPYSIGGIEYQRTQPIQWVRQSYYQSNHHVVAADDPSWTDTPPTPNLVRDTAFWNTSLIPATFGATAITMPGVYLVVFGGVASNYIPTIAPLYTYGAKKSPNNVYAYSTVTLDTGGITLFLKSVGGTVNTASFAYDGAGFLVGSSLNKSFETLTSSTNAKTLASGPGCATTAATDGVVSTADTLSYSSCRTHISAYGYAPLATLASDTAFIFYQGNAVQLLTMGSDVYYAAVAQVALPYPGIGIWVVLVMPEADVIGDVVTGRNTAIGITCGVFVVVACLSFALISLLLRPLTTIADRMMLAASLEDDGDDEKELSSMAEVEDLQQAYYAMNDELIRIRSFVPQTVLKTKRAVVVIDDTTEEDTKSNVKSPSHSIHSRMPQGSTRSGISKRSSHRSLANGLNVACGLASQTVTVVVANLNRFDAAVNDASRDLAVAGVADTVKMVYDVVAAQKGVVQSFHGDHFMASFNAVTPCAAHARRAAVAALHLVREARSVGLKLGMRAGVGTGRCLVGNLGSADAKSFSTIGSAFVHANVMERLTRVYGDGCHVLAAKRTCVDIATHVRYRYVDVVQLPRMKGPTLIGALLEEVAAPDEHRRGGGGNDGEWLYVVEGNGSSSPQGSVNNAFIALFDGKLEEANTLLQSIASSDVTPLHSRAVELRDKMLRQGLSRPPCRDLGLLYRAGYAMDALEVPDSTLRSDKKDA